jgi:2-(1,2-epoxy-1,2-dihydrophenyl)acetyl-CoA isomerase
MPAVVLSVDGAVATVTLDRPERLNAMNADLVDELLSILRELCERTEVRAVILTGAGRGFCAGGDVTSLAHRGGGERNVPSASRTREMMEIDELLHEMPKPVIACINGPCAGAGLSLAAACDLRYAAESAVFATAFLRVGMSGDHGGIWSVTRAVGPAKARELFLLGERFSASEAERVGLVHQVLPDAALHAHVGEVAVRLAHSAPTAMRSPSLSANTSTGRPRDSSQSRAVPIRSKRPGLSSRSVTRSSSLTEPCQLSPRWPRTGVSGSDLDPTGPFR